MRGWLVIRIVLTLAVFAPAPAWQGSARAENPEAGQKAKAAFRDLRDGEAARDKS